MKFREKTFTKHQIISNNLEDQGSWKKGEFVWCKMDTESPLVKKHITGLPSNYVWLISDRLNYATLISLELANENLSVAKSGQLEGVPLNAALNLIKRESNSIVNEKKRQAVIVQNNQQARTNSGWVNYLYGHNPIKIQAKDNSFVTVDKDTRFKVKRIGPDKNLVVFLNRESKTAESRATVDDLKLNLLITHSQKWLHNKF